MPEPRDPLLKVLTYLYSDSDMHINNQEFEVLWRAPAGRSRRQPGPAPAEATVGKVSQGWEIYPKGELCNDPSAGSPTETLLRLLLPLNDQVWTTFRPWVVVADLPGPVRKPH